MAKTLRKFETVTDLMVYEVTLTDAQAEVFEEDEDVFWEVLGGELDWEFKYDKAGDPDSTHEIVED